MQQHARISKLRAQPGFGDFLRQKRELHRLTQTDVGAIIGMRQTTVSTYERRDLVFSEEQLTTLAEHVRESPLPWLVAAGYQELLPAEESPESVSDVARRYDVASPVAPFPLRGLVLDYGAIRLAPTPARWGESAVLQYDVVTDTLHPDFRRGDALLLEAGESAAPGDLVIVHTRRGEHLYLYCGRTDRALLVGPPNAQSPAHPTELSEATIVGVLIDQVRRWKKPSSM